MDTQSRNLTIPRGKVLFAEYLPGTQKPGPYRDFGNCPEFSLSRESELYPHFSSQEGLKTKDEELTIDATLTGTVVTDDLKIENIERWFMGKATKQTTAALTASTMIIATAKENDYYQLGATELNPGGHRNVTNVIGKLTGTPATELVIGTDYTVDLDLGIVQVLKDQTASITFTFDAEASTRMVMLSGEQQIEGELKFIAMNPVGPRNDVIIPRARIAPNGEFALVNDPESTAWQTLPLSISALKKRGQPLAIVEGRPFGV